MGTRCVQHDRLGNLPRALDRQGDVDPGMGKHVDQPIDTEEFDTPTDQVTDAWLRDAEELGTSGFTVGLRPSRMRRTCTINSERSRRFPASSGGNPTSLNTLPLER